MASSTVAVIGTGNMGQSLIAGLLHSGHPKARIWGCDTHTEKLAGLKQKFGIKITSHNIEAVQAADVVLLAVKPQSLAPVVKELAPVIAVHKPLVISIAAGITSMQIQNWLVQDCAIIRCMPNTPALIGSGASALYANEHVKPAEKQLAEKIFKAVGIVVWLQDEKLMDVVTALSGSGPAYYFLIMDALQEAAIALGLPPDIAHQLSLQTAFGAASMALASSLPLAQLQAQVTSPGGTTEKAISVLENQKIRVLLKEALQAAKKRSEELALQSGES